MNTTQIIQSIKRLNPYCEHITLTTIFSQLVDGFHVCNYGTAGNGKSYGSLELLQKLGVNNVIMIDNTTTTKGLFQTFQEFHKQNILLDECSAIMRDKAAQDMIKLCMERKKIVWTKNNSVEEAEPYQGNIIINTNEKIQDSVIDRCFLNKTVQNKEMTLNYVDYFLDKKSEADNDFIDFLKQAITKEVQTLTSEEIQHVRTFLKKNLEDSEKDLGYSRRCVKRTLMYFTAAKTLFGKLDQEVLNFIEPFAKLYIVNEKTPDLLETLVGEGIDKATLIKRYSKETGYTEQHVRRIVNERINNKEFELKGRTLTPRRNEK